MVFESIDAQQAKQDVAGDESSPSGKHSPDPEPLNVRILHSLEETISSSVQAVKEAVIGAGVEDLAGGKQETGSSGGEVKNEEAEIEDGSSRSLLQSVEEKIVSSVHSVEETIVQSVQSVKEAVNAAAEAAVSPASGGKNSERNISGDPAVVDEAAILVHSVVQD